MSRTWEGEGGVLTSEGSQAEFKCSWVGEVEAEVIRAVKTLAPHPGSQAHYLDVVVWMCSHNPDPRCKRSVLAAIRRLARRGCISTLGRGRGLHLKLPDDLDPASLPTSYLKRSAFRYSISVRRTGARPRDGYWGLKTKILRIVYENRWGYVRVRWLAEILGVSDRIIRYHVKLLCELGLITRPKRGLVATRWLSWEEVNRILSEAGELAPVIEVIGLKCDYQDLKKYCRPKPFTVKHALFATDYSRRHLQREFTTLVDKSVLIELGGRSCPRKRYLINPAYPQKVPRHVHDVKLHHGYGGSRIWRKGRKAKRGNTRRNPRCHGCGQVKRVIFGRGGLCEWRPC